MNEGWVDARKYLLAVRRKAMYLGVDYVNGNFQFRNECYKKSIWLID